MSAGTFEKNINQDMNAIRLIVKDYGFNNDEIVELIGLWKSIRPEGLKPGDIHFLTYKLQVFEDYLEAYDSLYSDDFDNKLIRELFGDCKRFYGWTVGDLDYFLTADVVDDEDFLDAYYEYVRGQLCSDFVVLELDNGKYVVVGDNKQK